VEEQKQLLLLHPLLQLLQQQQQQLRLALEVMLMTRVTSLSQTLSRKISVNDVGRRLTSTLLKRRCNL
jgi:hypothetical protein